MDADEIIATNLIVDCLFGKELDSVEREETSASWQFAFGGPRFLNVGCPWRIIANGRLRLGHDDHAQKFGLPKPLDGIAECQRLLGGRTVQSVMVREETGDLTIAFSGGPVLEVLNTSSGYEGWNFSGPPGVLVVAMGGGALAIWNPPHRRREPLGAYVAVLHQRSGFVAVTETIFKPWRRLAGRRVCRPAHL